MRLGADFEQRYAPDTLAAVVLLGLWFGRGGLPPLADKAVASGTGGLFVAGTRKRPADMELNEIPFQAMGTNNWVGTPAASAYLGIGQRSLYRLIDRGELPAYQMGRVIRVKQEDLDAYLEPAPSHPAPCGTCTRTTDGADKERHAESP